MDKKYWEASKDDQGTPGQIQPPQKKVYWQRVEGRTGNLAGNRGTLSEHAAVTVGRSKVKLSMTRNVKDIKNYFCEYVGDKGNGKENFLPFLIRLDMEKFEVMTTALVSVCSDKILLQKSTILETREKVWSK